MYSTAMVTGEKSVFVYKYTIINTHGDTIYVFLWVKEDRQFLWSWFSDKIFWYFFHTDLNSTTEVL